MNCYDYIIVGFGTAGSIVARKLSDDPKNKVLLIEQGYWLSLNPNVREASKWRLLLTDPLVELGYVSVSQIGLNNRTIIQPRAKDTGGCNSHNALNDLSSYWNYINNAFIHTQLDAVDPMISKLLKSAEELGYKYNSNPNDLDSIQGQGGVAPRIFMNRKIFNDYVERVTSWNTDIEPILPRENLDMFVFTHVHKIL
ncbi:unnamed protein product, partial [Rotaria sp. Silwood1]